MSTKRIVNSKAKDFDSAFQGLRKLLKPYDRKVRVVKDIPGAYVIESKSLRYMGKPVMFASINTKSYVSFHLFPVYLFPDLVNEISAELKKRMQGKTCWNFQKVEEPLFAELRDVVDASFRCFSELGERDLTRKDMQALWSKTHSAKTRS